MKPMPSVQLGRCARATLRAAAPAAGHFSIVLSTAVHSALNMTVIAITSGAVLLCLFASRTGFDAAAASSLRCQP
jgi:hypothetical protein